MNKFVRNLLTEWRKLELPLANEKIVIAVSGGADSVSLTMALHDLKIRKKLKLNFIIAHFNHRLRGEESEKDEKFVRELALKLQFECIAKSSKFNIQNQKGNLEQNARQARYEFLYQVAQDNKAFSILTAHTKNDQAETFLLNLIRGSGLEGLAGIHLIRNEKKEVKIFRPLLNWASREDTEGFCLENNFEFRQDLMNEDLNFMRVRVRKEIIPLLKKINPRLVDTLAKTANLMRENLDSLQIDEGEVPEILNQNELKTLSKLMLMRTLRAWLNKHRGNLRGLEMKHFEAIEKLINSKKSGRLIELPNAHLVLKKEGKIFFEKSTVEKSRPDN